MLPAHLAENIKKQVQYYLQSTFTFRDSRVNEAFARFINDPENGIFKGPWVQLKRPFRPSEYDGQELFEMTIRFHPFLHQYRAWKRLSSRNQPPKSTIITTGTGSGKTECFLYPILDHCLRARREKQPGIKAIILYPMNALASDQEKRFASLIWKDAVLKAAGIRIGNYTGRYDASGGGTDNNSGTTEMGADYGITDHDTQQRNPPDILLTNYKMLDFLLMRPEDQELWRFNKPGVLQYLVLDELHTYDGAQGADVACLIRRLKEKLAIPRSSLCVIGTSATLDNRDRLVGTYTHSSDETVDARESGEDRLATFASTLFEEEIAVEAIIGEERLTVEEIVPITTEDITFPNPYDCDPLQGEDSLQYAQRQAKHWGAPEYQAPTEETEPLENEAIKRWSLELGAWIKKSSLFKSLLEIFHRAEKQGKDPLAWDDIERELHAIELGFLQYEKIDDRRNILVSFLALIAHANEERNNNVQKNSTNNEIERIFPLVPTQVQLWVRELARLGRIVSDSPVFNWLDEPVSNQHCLPTFHCNECGESGWIAMCNPSMQSRIQQTGVTGDQLISDPQKIYEGWFGVSGNRDREHSLDIVTISPWTDNDTEVEQQAGTQVLMADLNDYLCPDSLVLRKGDGPCPLTGNTRRFRVKVNRDTGPNSRNATVGKQGCPNCKSTIGILFVGSRGSTLSSVAVDEMFGSPLNDDPKLLAFTDSVQDASHRAGFLTARTYHFTFRTAVQHVIDDAGSEGIPLSKIVDRMFAYWAQDFPGRLGNHRETMATLMPSDLQKYKPYLVFREDDSLQYPPQALLHEISERLVWEVTSEFGIQRTIGRTLEKCGSACVGWDRTIINQTLETLVQRLEGIDHTFLDIPPDAFRLWLIGFLHYFTGRGGLDHPYLISFARNDFWGKYPFRKTISGRETHPNDSRYRPRLLVTKSQKDHSFVLAHTRQGGQSPWHIKWTRRSLGQPHVDETSILDMIRLLLKIGEETKLFKVCHQTNDCTYYSISADASILYSNGFQFTCSECQVPIIRPQSESHLWIDAPSMDYRSDIGKYQPSDFLPRQRYYQDRYRKGALRRVVAEEHTGLLKTEERELLERKFGSEEPHKDDPNVLTCTSTLEMGIDIGDLSSTMLCSVPPNTANYLQRIGRAGRKSGTALIISIVNQSPHDLFFYARPIEMLRGKVDPPGCWLDASAVLARQYLGYCFDCATRNNILKVLPRNANQLVDDLDNARGHINQMMDWVTLNEAELQSLFLQRFQENLNDDTRDRFKSETNTDQIRIKIRHAVDEFAHMRKDLKNAQSRLQSQINSLDDNEKDALQEIKDELRILKARIGNLNRTSSLEVLTDFGLLPNYAFPERGVRFHGAVYNKHQSQDQNFDPIEIVRPAGTALRELAPRNQFYTHSRKFDIQQIAIGNPNETLIEKWAICGNCGHLRRFDDLKAPSATPECPQCSHDGDAISQSDQGQQRAFIEFSRSQALSYMEHYESLSGDSDEERKPKRYVSLKCFDQTKDVPTGAVGDDALPFGIEYRHSIIMKDINGGHGNSPLVVPFGPKQSAPDVGFLICKDCGIAVSPNGSLSEIIHRRSCTKRRSREKQEQEGRSPSPFIGESVYLYRTLESEAIRLLLPTTDPDDIETLIACLYLGLRLRFEGNPAHLIISSQILPDREQPAVLKHFLVIMDGVPGGTGYLKTLYQVKDNFGREGEGIVDVLRRARDVLETCTCRKLKEEDISEDTDGCYRCIRTYHRQYNAKQISRERGIRLLNQLIPSAEHREPKKSLDEIKPAALFGSVLEKKFIEQIQDYVEQQQGRWEKTIIRGRQGFQFSLSNNKSWEIELQPDLGIGQGVMKQSRPDFLFTCSDESVKPIAVFTDGFQFHCHPTNNLKDDFAKRRAILESGNYLVWSITWDDLVNKQLNATMVCAKQVVDSVSRVAAVYRSNGKHVPDASMVFQCGFTQFLAFLACPDLDGWKCLAQFAAFNPLEVLAKHRRVDLSTLSAELELWRRGSGFRQLGNSDSEDWIYNDMASLTKDVICTISFDDVSNSNRSKALILARLGDTELEVSASDFMERWRRFLACMNLYQFCDTFHFWTTTEANDGTAPDLPLVVHKPLTQEWQNVLDNVTPSLKAVVSKLSLNISFIPQVEHYLYESDDEGIFAELAWDTFLHPIAILVGDQVSEAQEWQKNGWMVITLDVINARGIEWLIDFISKHGQESTNG